MVIRVVRREGLILVVHDTLHADAAGWTRFCHRMIQRGIYMNGGKVYCSAAHSDDDLRATIPACEGRG
jgi:glutamate-1-semialdehyde aminotransferase